MSNSLVNEYRKRVPNDHRSDQELTILFGRQNDIDGRYNNRPDFVQDYKSLTELPRVTAEPTLAGEFKKGVTRGVEGLKESAYGLGALATDIVDATSLRDALLQKYAESATQTSEEASPAVGKIEDIGSAGDVARYLAAKAGEMVPMVGEALLTGAAGAAIGTAAGPEGTAAGAVAGLGEGFFARQAARALLKSNLKKIIGDDVVEAAVRNQLGKIAAREAVSDLAPATRTLLGSQIKSTAARMGATGANVLNFYGIGAGGTFGALAGRPGIEDPQIAAIISGVGSAAGAVLPSTVIAKLFPGVGEEVARNYIMRLAKDAAKEIPVGASGMGVMELANIAAERYADPSKHGEPLTDEELSRIKNATVLGALMGGAMAPISAIRGPQKFDPAVEAHFQDVSQDRRQQLDDLKLRMQRGNPAAEDITAERTLTPSERAYYAVSRPEAQASREASQPLPPAAEEAAPPAEATPSSPAPPERTPSEAAPAELTPEQKLAEADSQRIAAARAMAVAANTPTATDPATEASLSRVKAAELQTNPNPTPAEKASGNYRKGKVTIQGLKISVENPKGSERSGLGADGKPWTVQMPATYGYILGTVGKDKDHLDVYIGPNPESKTVYMVDQVDPRTGKFDEHKIMLGYDSQAGAEATYDAAFSDASGPSRRGAVTAMSVDALKEWLASGKTKEPVGNLPVREEANANRQQGAVPEVPNETKAAEAPAEVAGGEPGQLQAPAGTVPSQPNAEAAGETPGNAPKVEAPKTETATTEPQEVQPELALPKVRGVLKEKIEVAKAEMADLLAEWDQEAAKLPRQNLKLSIDPRDYVGVSPKVLELMAKTAAKAIEIGAYKFTDFVASMVELLGEKILPFVTRLYESVRDYHTPDAKRGKAGNPELIKKLTPRADMADAIDRLAKKLKREDLRKGHAEAYSPEHVVKSADVDVEGRGTVAKSARSGGVNEKAREAWELERAAADEDNPLRPWEELTPEEKDAFIQSRPELAKEAVVVEPAWFVPREKNFDKLSKRLLSDSSPPQKVGDKYANNSMTFRLVALFDRDTGQVHLVSVFKNNNDVRVTKFGDEVFGKGGARKSYSLRDVLEAKSELGGRRFDVIGSARTKNLTEYYRQTFPDRKAFREEFAKDLEKRQKAVQSHATAEAEKMQTHGVEAGASEAKAQFDEEAAKSKALEEQITGAEEAPAQELPVTETAESVDVDVSKVLEENPGPDSLNLDANDVRALLNDLPGFEDVNDLVDMILSPESARLITDDLYAAIEKVMAEDKFFFQRVLNDGIEQVLKDYGYETDNLNAGKTQAVEPGPAPEAKAGVPDTAGGGGLGNSGPDSAVRGGENPIGQTEPAGAGEGAPAVEAGNAVAGGESAGEALKYNLPRQSKETEDRSRLLQSIHDAAAAAGIDVSVVRDQMSAGGYDRQNRALLQVIGDTVGRQDVKTAIHEVGHDVFANESPEMQQRILRAIDSISDEALGVDTSADPRIRASDPAGLGKAAVNEERLVDAAAEKLVREGFDPEQAKGFANRFVRALKAAYYKAAMFAQRLLGFKRNNELVRRYFENRVRQLLAGDTRSQSYFEWVGAVKPSSGERQRDWFPSANQLAERFDRYGALEYDFQGDHTLAAGRFNLDRALRYNLPVTDPNYSRVVEVEKLAAIYNHQIDLLDRMAKGLVEKMADKAAAAKMPAKEFMLHLLGIADPKILKDQLKDAREHNGEKVVFDESRTIDQFKHQAQRDATASAAYKGTQALLSKLGRIQMKASESIEALESKHKKLAESYRKARENYADFEHQTTEAVKEMRRDMRLLFREAAGFYKRQGIISQQLKALDPNAVLKDYVPVFEKLFTGKELESGKLMDLLDAAANDSSIDFSKPVNQIKDALLKANLEKGKPYLPLLTGSKESNALLATVAAFAKTHEKTMAELELRRMQSGEKRAEIERSIAELKENQADLGKGVRALAKTAKLEERYRKANLDALRKLRSVYKRLTKTRDQMAAVKLVTPTIMETMGDLSARLQLGADATWGHGMNYNVPQNPTSDNNSVVLSKRTLSLDSSGKVTNPLEVEADMRKMAEWMAERERRYNEGDIDAKDGVYQGVLRQFREMALHKNYSVRLGPAQRFMLELNVLPGGKRIAEAFGTPAARMIDQMINRFTDIMNELRPESERVGRRSRQMEDDLLKLMPGIDENYLRDNFLNPAKKLMQRQHDLEELYAGEPGRLKRAIYGRVREKLLENDATRPHVEKVIDKFMPALEKLLEFQHQANQYLLERVRRAETGVADPKLRVLNPATGEIEPGVRKHLQVGAYTWSQKLHPAFKIMVNALRNSDWASAGERIKYLAEVYNEQGPDQARAQVRSLFENAEYKDQVQNAFFRALAEMDTESPFHAPAMEDAITRPPADPTLVKEAFDAANGDPVKFAEQLYDLHEGATDKGQYVQEVMQTLTDIYREADSIMKKSEPDGTDRVMSVRGMSADALIDARHVEHLPATWFDYHSFDQRDMFKMMERIAAQTAFGRGQERLGAAFDTVANEVRVAQNRLATATEEVKRANPVASAKEIKAKLTAKFGKDEYQRLVKMSDRGRFVGQTVRELSDYFRRDLGPDGTLRAMTRVASLLGSLLVNQPSSAIAQMAALLDINIRYGGSASTLGATAKALGAAGKEVAASLAQAIGLEIFNGGEYHRRYVSLGLTDATAVKRFRDAFDRLQGESRLSHFFRGANDILGMGWNTVGEKAEHTVFRPLQPFTTSAIAANKALTEGIWKLVGDHVMRGMEYYKAHPDELADPNHRLDPAALKISGAAKDSFLRLHEDLHRWGMNYDDMVRGALDRGDKTLFTDEEALRLYSMMISEVSSESNLSTMPLHAYNNKLIRFATPLLGWSFRRMIQIGGLRLNPEGMLSMRSLAHAMAGLSVTAVGGLALSALIDEYYQELLGKKRNLRPVLGAPNAQEAALGVLENLNRVGTFGFFGELANTFVNVGQGGDNRAISVDQRVVALSAFQSISRAITSWIHQGEADYAHVVRPLASSVGGGGLLQYMQLANKALGLDNPESRLTARMNAQNYLRVIGRQLELDVRTFGGGGYSAPTPITPYLTRMELAAYANDSGAFMQEYRAAIEKAREMGNDDPVAYIKRAYASRNPLRQVFRTPPTESQYRQILSSLPDDGRQDVSEAVNAFNFYANQIGARPFEGKGDNGKSNPLKAPKLEWPQLDTTLIRKRQTLNSLFSR